MSAYQHARALRPLGAVPPGPGRVRWVGISHMYSPYANGVFTPYPRGMGAAEDGPDYDKVCDFVESDWVIAVQNDLIEKGTLRAPNGPTGVFDEATCSAYVSAYKEAPTAENLAARYVPPDHHCASMRVGCLTTVPPEEPAGHTLLKRWGPRVGWMGLGVLVMTAYAAVTMDRSR